jgi:putative DNA primase/helicase
MTLFSSDRIIIIPFDRHFDEQTRDTTLKRRFAEEGVRAPSSTGCWRDIGCSADEGLHLPQNL